MFRAYAKINLGLFVTAKRPDGYHSIETVFYRIDLADEIGLEPSETITVTTNHPGAPSGESNICFTAAMLLRNALGTRHGVSITIDKHIPVGAGLGGGSADAGTIVRELPGFWGTTLDDRTSRIIALELGSDVPFFLGSGSAFGSGRGEILRPFDLDIPYSILLCSPGIHVSTAWAYRQVTPHANEYGRGLNTLFADALPDPRQMREKLRNDFEPAVFHAHPEIGRVKEDMLRGGAVFASMSGSGSSVYGMFDDDGRMRETEEGFRKAGYRTFITPPHFRPPARIA